MSVVSMVVGGTTSAGATFVAKVGGGGPVRVAVADNASMTSPVFTASQAVDAQGVAKVSIAGLLPSTRYWWQVEDNAVVDTSLTGQFLTHPSAGVAGSFTMAFAACAGGSASVPGVGTLLDSTRISNHPVFDTIRSMGVAGGWLGFHHLGDAAYYDPGSGVFVPDASLTTYRRMWDDILAQPNQAGLMRELDFGYIWDDHDFGPNNSDGTHVDKANAAQAVRERLGLNLAESSGPIYRSWQIGRVLFIAWDVRYNRSPNTDPDGPSKTMLGSAQKTWMQDLLTSPPPGAEFLVVLSGSQWLWPSAASGVDTWANFATERDEIATMFATTGWADRMCMVYGDRHGSGIDSGASNPWGGFPVLVPSSLDSDTGAASTGLYDVLDDTQGRGQWGTLAVSDLGSAMTVELTARRDAGVLGSYQFGLSLQSPTVTGSAQVVEFAEHMHGSHTPLFEARVLTSFQTGANPTGTTIPIVGGDVRFDNTGDIFASLQLTTGGIDEDQTGESRFPRLAADLLAPYGNEIWVRRGIDLGGEILWSPLGYFRIDSAEQPDAPYGEIAISGQDRMAGIVDARLVQPREFPPGTTVSGVFAVMVGEVYPDAIVVFDDDTGFAGIGNTLTFDEDRLATLVELIDAYGKVMYWDGEGILRVESPPDESQPLWEVKAGQDGVLVSSGRRVSREGVFNGVVARGEGGDQTTPISAVAVDIGPTSPTRWGGRFGKVPRFQTSPFIKTQVQALAAARATLGRQLGAPHVVSFGAVVNPGLRPWHPIRVEQRDGNREVHVVQSVSVPLTADAVMNGETREKTQILIGQVTS